MCAKIVCRLPTFVTVPFSLLSQLLTLQYWGTLFGDERLTVRWDDGIFLFRGNLPNGQWEDFFPLSPRNGRDLLLLASAFVNTDMGRALYHRT